VDVQDIEGTAAVDLVEPIDLIQPPGKKVDACMGCLVVSRWAGRPKEIPAAGDGAETNRLRVPFFDLDPLQLKDIRQLGVSGMGRMDIGVGTIPNLGLIVHVVRSGNR
jgi:hypothetical protein